MRTRTRGQNGIALVGPVPKVPARKQPRIDVLGVLCPTCRAVERAPCVTVAGNTHGVPVGRETASHDSRRRMATRRRNEMLDDTPNA